jgi:hypothetical protein
MGLHKTKLKRYQMELVKDFIENKLNHKMTEEESQMLRSEFGIIAKIDRIWLLERNKLVAHLMNNHHKTLKEASRFIKINGVKSIEQIDTLLNKDDGNDVELL